MIFKMMEKHWNSYHLYCSSDADSVLNEVVYPVVLDMQQERMVKFFFVRYFDDGYHIRLRLLLSAEESALFHPLLKKYILLYEDLHDADLVLKEALYLPETERYGNTGTIAYAESQFYASSKFVLHHLVKNGPLTDSQRYLLAMKAHFAFFEGMGLSQNYSQMLCDKFIQNWLPLPFCEDAEEHEDNRKRISSAFQQQFESYKTLLCTSLSAFRDSIETVPDPVVQEFLEINRRVRKKYNRSGLPSDAVDEAMLSFMHMTNNRIGIINSEESYVLFLLMKTIPLLNEYDNK